MFICVIAYLAINGSTSYEPVEGVKIKERYNLTTERTEWLIDANAFMVRTGMRNNLNPGMVWADSNLCLKIE